MDGTLVTDHRPTKKRVDNWSAHDKALIRAKVEKSIVLLSLAVETEYTNSEGSCRAKVVEVDRFSVKFEIDGRGIWVGKAFIVSTEILNG